MVVGLCLVGALLAIFLPPQLVVAVILVLSFNLLTLIYSRLKLKTKSIMPLFNGTAENLDAPRIVVAFAVALFGAMCLAYLARSYFDT